MSQIFDAGTQTTIERDSGTDVDVTIYKLSSHSGSVYYSCIDVNNGQVSDATSSLMSKKFYDVVGSNDTRLFCAIEDNSDAVILYVNNIVPSNPDLAVSQMTVDDNTYPIREFVVGETVKVRGIVWNNGNGTAPSTRLGYYINSSSSLSGADRWEDDGTGELEKNEGSSENEEYTFTEADIGTRYFILLADWEDDVDEGDNEDNNDAHWGPFQVVAANECPTVTIVSPATSVNIAQGDTLQIQWNGTDGDDAATVAIAYDDDRTYGGTGFHVIQSSLSEDGSINWDTSSVAPGTYYLYAFIEDGKCDSQFYTSYTVVIGAPPPTTVFENWTNIVFNGIAYTISAEKNAGAPSLAGKSLSKWGNEYLDIAFSPSGLSNQEQYELALIAENKLMLSEGYRLPYSTLDIFHDTGNAPETRTNDQNGSNSLKGEKYKAVKSTIADAMRFGVVYYDGWTLTGGLDNPNVRRRKYRDIIVELALDMDRTINTPSILQGEALLGFIDSANVVSNNEVSGLLKNISSATIKEITEQQMVKILGDLITATQSDQTLSAAKKLRRAAKLSSLLTALNGVGKGLKWSTEIVQVALTRLYVDAEAYARIDALEAILQQRQTSGQLYDPEIFAAISEARGELDNISGDWIDFMEQVILGTEISMDAVLEKTKNVVLTLVSDNADKIIEKLITKNPKAAALLGGVFAGVYNTFQSLKGSVNACMYASLQLSLLYEIDSWIEAQSYALMSNDQFELVYSGTRCAQILGIDFIKKNFNIIDGHWYSAFFLDPVAGLNFIRTIVGGYDEFKNTLTARKNKLEELIDNSTQGFYFIDPVNAAKIQQVLFDGTPVVPNSPQPLLTVIETPGNVRVGEEALVRVRVQNTGGVASTSYFDISCSNNLADLDLSPIRNLTHYAIGSNIWHNSGSQIVSDNVLYSYVFSNLEANFDQEYEIRMTAREAGTQWVKIRLAYGKDLTHTDFARYPTSGTTDQQGFYALPISFTVAQNTPPTINSHAPSANSILIHEGETAAFSVSYSDADSDPVAVTWLINNQPIAQGQSLNLAWDQTMTGTHTLTAIVADDEDAVQQEWSVIFVDINDRDGDGVNDDEDAFPDDVNEWLDTDTDGIGNNADTDDDGDGMPDDWEIRNDLNPLVNDADLDPDEDKKTNYQEYLDGSNPQASCNIPIAAIQLLLLDDETRSSSSEKPTFVPYTLNPVITDTHVVKVVYHDSGEYRALSHHSTYSKARTSADGLLWSELSSYDILNITLTGKSYNRYPYEIKENGIYKIWGCATSNALIAGTELYYVTSTDGINYESQGKVLSYGGLGTYDSRNINNAQIVEVNGTYHLYYSATPGCPTCYPDHSLETTIAHATSPDGVNWTKQGVTLNGRPGEFDENVDWHFVIHDGSRYEMFYRGIDASDSRSIGFAISIDGHNWTRCGKIEGLNGDRVIGCTKINGQYKVWYHLEDGSGVGYATSN